MAVATESETARVPWDSPTLRVVLASTLVLPMAAPLLSPGLPAIRDAYGLTDAATSLVVTAYFLPGVVLSPLMGALSDRVGRRRVIVPSLVLFGLFGGLVAFEPPYEAVVAFRLAQGAAAAGVFILTVTLVGDVFRGLQRNAVFGVNAAALFFAAALYPVVGGLLVARSWRLLFVAYLLAVPVGLFAYLRLPEPEREPEVEWLRAVRGAFTALPAGPAVGLYGAALASEVLSLGVIFTALPFYLVGRFEVAPVQVGLVLTTLTVISAAVAARNASLARRVRDEWLVAASFVLVGASLLGVWLAPAPLAVALALVPFGVAEGVILPSVDAAVTNVAPRRYRAGALSIRNSTTFLGRAAGPFLFTALATPVGYPTLLAVSGGGALLVGVVAVRIVER